MSPLPTTQPLLCSLRSAGKPPTLLPTLPATRAAHSGRVLQLAQPRLPELGQIQIQSRPPIDCSLFLLNKTFRTVWGPPTLFSSPRPLCPAPHSSVEPMPSSLHRLLPPPGCHSPRGPAEEQNGLLARRRVAGAGRLPSCVCAASWGACRTYRTSCRDRACRWCARACASCGRCYWQNVGRSPRTRT